MCQNFTERQIFQKIKKRKLYQIWINCKKIKKYQKSHKKQKCKKKTKLFQKCIKEQKENVKSTNYAKILQKSNIFLKNRRKYKNENCTRNE